MLVRNAEVDMTTFAMLTKLSHNASHRPDDLAALERDVVKHIEQECPQLRWVANYVVLGDQSYLDVFEAPDVATALKAGLVVDTFGNAETQIWPLIDWEQFKRTVTMPQRPPNGRSVAKSRGKSEGPEERSESLLNDVIDYLRKAGAQFRLTSYPLPEAKPTIAHVLRSGGKIVETRVVLIEGRPALACAPEGVVMSNASLSAAIGAAVMDAGPGDLTGRYRDAPEPLPPLGHLLHVPLLVDESLTKSATITFRAFGGGSLVEVPYEDFARIEQPKVLSVAIAGELGPARPIVRARTSRPGRGVKRRSARR